MLRLNKDRRRSSPLTGDDTHPRPRAIDTANALQLCDGPPDYCGAQRSDSPASMRTRRGQWRDEYRLWRALRLSRLAERIAHRLLRRRLVGGPHRGRGRAGVDRRRHGRHGVFPLDAQPKLPVETVEIGHAFVADLHIDARSAGIR